MTSILLVRLSSMGDLIHTFPALSDLRERFPDAEVDWVAEEGFAELPGLHPAVRRAIPMAWRRWRKSLWSADTRREMRDFFEHLRERPYDLVIDAQSLLKSAVVARMARGLRAGLDRRSAREPLAALFYDKGYAVAKGQHAVLRNRLLLGAVMGYAPDGPPVFGLEPSAPSPAWLPLTPYVVFLHATSKEDKEWPPEHWLEVGRAVAARGYAMILPWGNAREQERSRALAAELPGAVVPEARLSLAQAATLLQESRLTIGVDTGLTHLANAVDCPLVAIYTVTDPGLTGVTAGPRAVNLGGRHGGPDAAAVLAEVSKWLV